MAAVETARELSVGVVHDNLWYGWDPEELKQIDQEASIDRYIDLLIEELEDRYPEAKIVIRQDTVHVPDYLVDHDEAIYRIKERVFDRGDWIVRIGQEERQ